MVATVSLFALAYLCLIGALCRASHNAHKRDFIAGVDDYSGP